MRMLGFLRVGSGLICALSAMFVIAQASMSIPPNLDPHFWGKTGEPYALTLMITKSAAHGGSSQPSHVMKVKVYRDGSGRERTESFYDNGQPMSVQLRDPSLNSTFILKVVDKTALEIPLIRPEPPPPGKGWTVEQLPSRVIAGYPAHGQRFRRTIPAESTGTGPPVTTVEDVWTSDELGVVLEETFDDPRTGKTTKTVTEFEKTVPDPALFSIPSDYAVQKPVPAGHPS